MHEYLQPTFSDKDKGVQSSEHPNQSALHRAADIHSRSIRLRNHCKSGAKHPR